MSANELHPDLERIGRFVPREPVRPRTVPLIRAATSLMARRTPRDIEVRTLPSGIRVRLCRPVQAGSGGALLWIHGGGYVVGTAAQDDALCRRFSRRLDITVASVDYRLAPEHPVPVPLEDCYEALRWLTERASIDRAKVAIGGASAGGGLAAALAQLAHDRGEVDVAAQLLVYPMLDDRTVDRPGMDHEGLRMWNPSSNRFGWASYLGGADPATAVPARRADLSGLPPAWIGVGTLDLFHDEDLEYAQRLEAADVPCRLEVVPGAFHAFDGVAPKAEVTRRFLEGQCSWLSEVLDARGS